jgi:hypothetical protein
MSEAGSLKGLVVRPIADAEQARWIDLMGRHHYLGFHRLVGIYLCYVAILNDQWVGLLSWSWAALKNAPRERWVGWNVSLKEKRLRYVVNNMRFLILPWVCLRNLASRILALNCRRLPSDWDQLYGHPPVLAETFVDGSRFSGTCYKAAGWIEVGHTSGFAKNGVGYVRHDRPKKVFLRPLHPRAREILTAPFLPGIRKEESWVDANRLPLRGEGGLVDLMDTVPDPRKRRGIRHRLGPILSLATCAVLSGAKSYVALAQYGKTLSEEALKTLGFRRGKPPSEPTLRRTIQSVNADQVDAIIGQWLIERVGGLQGKAISVDGKTLRGSHNGEKKAVQLLSAIVHKEGIVVAQKRIEDKTNEIPMVRALLGPLSIEGAMITVDALNTQTGTGEFVVKEKKADFLMVAKDNQPTLKNDIAAIDDGDFSPSVLHDG